jgi:hypothetical protein
MFICGVDGRESSSSLYLEGVVGGEDARMVDERREISSVVSMSSWYDSATRLMASSGSGSRSSSSSSSSCRRCRPVVMNHTPRKVMAQPPTNLPASSPEVRSKSRYRTADPRITESVKRTNCTGMTCVASKRCNARLMYLICITAVPIKMARRR